MSRNGLQPRPGRAAHGSHGGGGSYPSATIWWNVGLMRSWRSPPSAATIPSVPALPSHKWLLPDSQSGLPRCGTSGAGQKFHFHPGALKWLGPPSYPLNASTSFSLWKFKWALLARIGFFDGLAHSGFYELDAQDEVLQNYMTRLMSQF